LEQVSQLIAKGMTASDVGNSAHGGDGIRHWRIAANPPL